MEDRVKEWEHLRARVQAVLSLDDHRWRNLKVIPFPLRSGGVTITIVYAEARIEKSA